MKLRGAIAVLWLLLFAAPAFSQGCVMCYSSAKGASDGGQKAIRNGVIILLIPPLGFMSLGVWIACRYASKRDLEAFPASVHGSGAQAKVLSVTGLSDRAISAERPLLS